VQAFILTLFNEYAVRKLLIAPAFLQPSGCREVIVQSPLFLMGCGGSGIGCAARGVGLRYFMPYTVSTSKGYVCGATDAGSFCIG